MPKTEILDPQGKAVEQALHQMGLGTVSDVRIGKKIEFNIEAGSESEAMEKINFAGKGVLANMTMEDFSVQIENV